MSTFTILDITQQDSIRIDDLCELRDRLMEHVKNPSPSTLFRQFVLKHLGEETMLIFLILDDNNPIGYGLAFDVNEHPYMPEWTRKGYITQYYVDAKYRWQGVGVLGLNYIHEWFASRGITDALLNVHIDNEIGNRFWKKHGYVPVATYMKRHFS